MPSFKKIILPLIVFFCAFIVYAHNLSRVTYGGDVGDLLATSVIMGVAHPPGYPLFTIVGFLLSRINFISPAFMIGLISVFSGALGAALFYLLAYKLTKSKLISLICILILACSYYFWFYNEIAEVFALNNLFAIALLLVAFLYSQSKQKKYLFLLSFLAGLSLTNHQTIVLIFPSLLILSFGNLRKDFRSLKTFLVCVGLFVVGLLPYIYIPIAASHNPVVNWDKVHDLNSFLRLILRKDYGTFSIGNYAPPTLAQRLITLKLYFFDLLTQATLPGIVVVCLGMFHSFKKYKKTFFALLIGFVLSGPFFVLYAGFPLLSSFSLGVYERFIVLSFVMLLMFLPFGFLFIKVLLEKAFSKKEYVSIVLCAFFVIPLMLFRFNFLKTDLRKVTLGEDIVYDLLSPLPKNSVIFVDGDTIMFNAWYVHYAKKFRPDIEVINSSGAIDNKLYQNAATKYFKEHSREVVSRSADAGVVAELAKTRSIFSISDIQPIKGKSINWVPYGLSYKLLLQNKPLPEEDYVQQLNQLWSKLHVPYEKRSLAEGSYTVADLFSFYAQALIRTGQYFADNYHDKNRALEYYKKAVEVDPENNVGYEVLGAYYIQNNNCKAAEVNLKKSISILPYESLPYFFLYYDYRNCFKSTAKINSLVSEYNNNLRTDFYKDLKNMSSLSK